MTKITDLTGAAPDSADVIPYVDVSDTTEDAAGTAKKTTVSNLLSSVDTSGLLPKTGGTMTGTLTYSGDGVATSIDQASETAGHRFWEYSPAHTPDLKWHQWIGQVSFAGDPARDDITWNWGYNQGGQGGVVNSEDSSWYLQLENHYFPPGNGVAQYEYHLNYFSSDGLTSYRPFQVNCLKNGSSIDWQFTGDDIRFQDRADAAHMTLGPSQVTIAKPLIVNDTARAVGSVSVLNNTAGVTAVLAVADNGKVTLSTAGSVELESRGWSVLDLASTTWTWTGSNATFTAAGTLTMSGALLNVVDDPSTDTDLVIGTYRRKTTGTAAAGMGGAVAYQLEGSNGVNYDAGRILFEWSDATWNTRRADIVISPYDTAAREALRLRADGAQALVIMSGIPTSDPAVAGALWSDGGTVKVSSG